MERIQFKKKDLINVIQNLQPFSQPKIRLEQYTIDAVCAVNITYFAGVEFDDIRGKVVLDLGVGTGRLSVASAFLLPKFIIGIDIDPNALSILVENKEGLAVEGMIHPLCCSVDKIPLNLESQFTKDSQITTIMNPPFGVQKKYSDRKFLKAAMMLSDVIYSIHLANDKVHNFIKRYVKKFGWTIDYALPYNMIIEGTFPFHKKNRKQIEVNVYRFLNTSER